MWKYGDIVEEIIYRNINRQSYRYIMYATTPIILVTLLRCIGLLPVGAVSVSILLVAVVWFLAVFGILVHRLGIWLPLKDSDDFHELLDGVMGSVDEIVSMPMEDQAVVLDDLITCLLKSMVKKHNVVDCTRLEERHSVVVNKKLEIYFGHNNSWDLFKV